MYFHIYWVSSSAESWAKGDRYLFHVHGGVGCICHGTCGILWGSPNFILADPPKGALYHQRASWQALLAEGPLWEGSHWLGEGGPLERVCQGGAPCPIPREKSGTEVERPASGAVYSTPWPPPCTLLCSDKGYDLSQIALLPQCLETSPATINAG